MIDGLDKLMRKFEGLARNVADDNLERGVANQMKIVQADAKLNCPVNNGELRQSIKTMTEREVRHKVTGTCYTNKAYAVYVEMGTGPKGDADHAGISPAVSPAYTLEPWWIHESQIDADVAEQYHWFYIDTDEGRFYKCSGQAASPFMYPALKNNEDRVTKNLKNYIAKKIREAATK